MTEELFKFKPNSNYVVLNRTDLLRKNNVVHQFRINRPCVFCYFIILTFRASEIQSLL